MVIPGNVYNFGEAMPARLTEDSPQSPTTCKGRLRVEMELAYANASADGVRTIIVRAGDYIEREKTGNWFDGTIAGKIETGNVVYPGPMNAVHAWAYLPDLGRVMAALADRRGEFEDFEAFGFPGFALTGTALVASMEEASGGDLKVKGLPWPIIRLLGVFKPMMREIAEMSYLWRTPHAIDGAKLAAAFGGSGKASPRHGKIGMVVVTDFSAADRSDRPHHFLGPGQYARRQRLRPKPKRRIGPATRRRGGLEIPQSEGPSVAEWMAGRDTV